MYQKIADYVNEKLNLDTNPIEADDVEQYLREGSSPYIEDGEESAAIDEALEKFL